MEGIIKIVKSLEDSGGKQFKMKLKNKWKDFLVCHWVQHQVQLYQEIFQPVKRINRAGYGNKKEKEL